MEILRQHPGPLDAIFVAVGGGGLIAGDRRVRQGAAPEIRVIGVQTERLRRDGPVPRGRPAGGSWRTSACSPTAPRCKQVGEETFRLAASWSTRSCVVDTDAVCAAIKDVFEDTRSILEPAGALAVAGVKA